MESIVALDSFEREDCVSTQSVDKTLDRRCRSREIQIMMANSYVVEDGGGHFNINDSRNSMQRRAWSKQMGHA